MQNHWLLVAGISILMLVILLMWFGPKLVPAPVSPAVIHTDSCRVDSLAIFTAKQMEDSMEVQFKIVKLFTYRGVTVYRFNWPSMYIGSKEGTFQVDTLRKGK
jgi:hypothetical protein